MGEYEGRIQGHTVRFEKRAREFTAMARLRGYIPEAEGKPMPRSSYE